MWDMASAGNCTKTQQSLITAPRDMALAAAGDDIGNRADDQRKKGSAVVVRPDGTVLTKSGSLSAHFEHTVAITASGPVILTR